MSTKPQYLQLSAVPDNLRGGEQRCLNSKSSQMLPLSDQCSRKRQWLGPSIYLEEQFRYASRLVDQWNVVLACGYLSRRRGPI